MYLRLSFGRLATETSLKAMIDIAASVQCPFRLVLEVAICELGLFLPTHQVHAKIKHFKLFLVIIPNRIYLLIQTLYIQTL